MCVACRVRLPKLDLVRFVAGDSGLRVDARQQAPGRGAYICGAAGCLAQAVKRGAFSRSIGADLGRLDAEGLRRAALESLTATRSELVSGARRGGWVDSSGQPLAELPARLARRLEAMGGTIRRLEADSGLGDSRDESDGSRSRGHGKRQASR
jgi:predicted RNA-binding protein YlxR (DUF448 family)